MTFLLDPYAARSCPVKTFNAFDPGTAGPAEPLDESLREAFGGGTEHRRAVLARVATGADVVDLGPATHPLEATLAAMADEVPTVIGGRLPVDPAGHRRGHPDLLVRGDGGYWPVVIKPYRVLEKQSRGGALRRSPLTDPTALRPLPNLRYRTYREGALLELAHLWRLLQACDSAATTALGGIVGSDEGHTGHITWVPLDWRFLRTFSRTSASGYRLRSALERYDHEHGFRVHVAEEAMRRVPGDDRPPVVRPIRVAECEWCAWWETCRPRMDDDDISLRISKTPLDVRELQTLMGLGITTVDQLAQADVEELLPHYLPLTAHRDRSEARLRQAARRARMLAKGVALEKVSHDPIGTPRSRVEIDLDIETDDHDRTYLWGALLTDRGTGEQEFHHFASFTRLRDDAEVELATRFGTWLLEQVASQPDLIVFHYSDYEVVHLRRLAARSGSPVLRKVLDLVKDHFVDLFELVRDNFVGVEGLGLKVVASTGAGFSWRDEEPGGLNSQLWFATAVDAPDAATREAARTRVLEYNEDDVLATWHLRQWMQRIDDGTQVDPL
ncbi:MAG: TM0106 family RecB-like putative nuclease [Arachnia propionica]|uniref:TM0106 family RecB-like putative nuclease n=1 Tax=Arachnia propionica TaxID=1750 RepID=UPI002702A1AC|nr:TM0106 family RecB-like putative nuclease [Arachnia propionica]